MYVCERDNIYKKMAKRYKRLPSNSRVNSDSVSPSDFPSC